MQVVVVVVVVIFVLVEVLVVIVVVSSRQPHQPGVLHIEDLILVFVVEVVEEELVVTDVLLS